ncbi:MULTISPECIES: hypothetical protein [Hymenobacter]|uniref:Phospholipase_D-nuclease N-terminal n=1 Tax=Hymenobacter mucosus TaxID=1411120 RepID=A0A238XT70_9BACT|nr:MULTISPECIES: hypothetical protein [Hymenobacter]SNR62246.1 hypothetical protein SAMN06269173_104393 [Hymenobacter mucosus]
MNLHNPSGITILAAALALLLPALITVYVARMYGRSGWRWLLIALVLPFVSVFLIMALVSRESRQAEAEEDARRQAERASRRPKSGVSPSPTDPIS